MTKRQKNAPSTQPEATEILPEESALPSAPADHEDDGRPLESKDLLEKSSPSAGAVFMQEMTLTHTHNGPIPPAEILGAYERIQPGLGKKIVGWADMQIRHRIEMECLATIGAERRMNRGQMGAWVLSGVGIVAATISSIWGSVWASAVIACVAVGGPQVATILGHALGRVGAPKANPRLEELEDKGTPAKTLPKNTKPSNSASGGNRPSRGRRRS